MQLNGKGVGANSLFFGGISGIGGIVGRGGIPYGSMGGMSGHGNQAGAHG